MKAKKNKYIELLQVQLAKLDENDFDLEAWKSGANVMLARIFGESSSKLSQIDAIKFDFGSWSLRDSTGSKDHMESCKKRGRGILEACIVELEILGAEDEIEFSDDESFAFQMVNEAIEEELKMSQYKQLIKIIRTKSSREEKKRMLFTALMGFDPESASKIVAGIMTHPGLAKKFKK